MIILFEDQYHQLNRIIGDNHLHHLYLYHYLENISLSNKHIMNDDDNHHHNHQIIYKMLDQQFQNLYFKYIQIQTHEKFDLRHDKKILSTNNDIHSSNVLLFILLDNPHYNRRISKMRSLSLYVGGYFYLVGF